MATLKKKSLFLEICAEVFLWGDELVWCLNSNNMGLRMVLVDADVVGPDQILVTVGAGWLSSSRLEILYNKKVKEHIFCCCCLKSAHNQVSFPIELSD